MSVARFEQGTIIDKVQTAKKGRPVFVEGVLATIVIDSKNDLHFEWKARQSGETDEQYEDRLPNEIKLNWLRELKDWEEGCEHIQGTPLEQLAWLTAPQARNLKSVGIYSVEQLAKASDSQIEPVGMVGATLRIQAKSWLEEQSGQSIQKLADLQKQIDELRHENELLKGVVPSAPSVDDDKSESEPKRLGRPRSKEKL